ncbi:MAG TPA: choice-of-anchor tandem repeat NxxGxxAF-containing protein [Verrucomicrobium sp.]|nr:choice-of-anchor tandem repeat NxxGxxAF-containing protein [Verrucomicrobium sp.]
MKKSPELRSHLPQRFRFRSLLLTVALALPGLGLAQQHKTFIMGTPGMATPDGLDTFQTMDSFAISDRGAVFRGYLTNAKVSAVYSLSAKGARELLRPGSVVPGYGTITGSIGSLRTNNSSETAVYVGIRDANSVSRDALVAGSSISNRRVVVIADQTIPDGSGQFNSYSEGVIDNQGDVGFWGAIQNNGYPLLGSHGIFIGHTNGSITQVMRTRQLAPDEAYTVSSLDSSPILRRDGQIFFCAALMDPAYGTGDNRVLYRRKKNGDIVRVARSRQPAPGTSRYFSSITVGNMNDSGDTVFYALLKDAANAPAGAAIFKGSSQATLSPVVYTGQTVPGGLGTYTALDNSVGINPDGRVAYVGYYTGNGSGGGSGVFLGNGVSQRNLVRTGQTAPGGATYTGFAMSRANENDVVIFAAQLNGHQTYQGIFLTDGTETIKVAQAGDTVDGRTIEQIGVDPRAFNGLQQVAYQAKFSGDSGYSILLFAPRLKWRGHSGGSWHDALKWTASLIPAEYNDVDIIPDDPVEVLGPLYDTTIGSLRIGNTQSGTTDFKLQTGVVTATGGVVVLQGGSVSGVGTIVGDMTNGALVSPGNSPGIINLTGNYTQLSTGTLNVEVSGAKAGQYDRLLVDGRGFLSGNLNVVLLGDAIRTLNGREQLVVMSSTGPLTGTFANVVSGTRISVADGLASFLVTVSGTEIILSDFKPLDTDSDGLPDYWMQENFGSATASAENFSLPTSDADGDGKGNADEYVSGTQPKDAASFLRPLIVTEPSGGLSLSFDSVLGRTYKVQTSTDLKVWEDFQTDIEGDGQLKSVSVPVDPGASGATSRFYRVNVSR